MGESTERQSINSVQYQYTLIILTSIFHWPSCKCLMYPRHSHPYSIILSFIRGRGLRDLRNRFTHCCVTVIWK